MATNHKPRKTAGQRVERGQEADDTRPLYAADAIHPTEEAKFSFDSDGPVGGPVADIRSPIDEADELDRQGRGRTESEEDEDGGRGPIGPVAVR